MWQRHIKRKKLVSSGECPNGVESCPKVTEEGANATIRQLIRHKTVIL